MVRFHITRAIRNARVMVLVFSRNSNNSGPVLAEVETAFRHGAVIIPFRIEDVAPSDDMDLYLGTSHWLDAMTGPLEAHLERLCETVCPLVATLRANPGLGAAAAPRELQPPPVVNAQSPASQVLPAERQMKTAEPPKPTASTHLNSARQESPPAKKTWPHVWKKFRTLKGESLFLCGILALIGYFLTGGGILWPIMSTIVAHGSA